MPSQHFNKRSPIVFMHVPKTAGTALTYALKESLKPQRPFLPVYDGILFGAFNRFKEMKPGLRELIYLDIDKMPSDADFVAGHVSLSTLHQKYPEAQAITFLRDPISRILSHWRFFRGLSVEALDAWEPFSDVIRLSHGTLQQFLSDPGIACQIDNLCVRMLLWPHPLIPDDGFISSSADEKLLEEAVPKLSQFSYSDVVENPDFRRQLQDWLGMTVSIPRLNETPPIPAAMKPDLRSEISIEAVEALCSRTRLDTVLWQHVAVRHGGVKRSKILGKFGLLQSMIRYVGL